MASVVKSPTSPSRATNNMTTTSTPGAAIASTTPLDIADDDDLDPAAFLQSVRELSAKREREDNERFRKLEEEIEKGRQERLARRAEYARSLSPEKRDSVTQSTTRFSRTLPSRPSSTVAPSNFSISTPTASTPPSTITPAETPTKSSPVGVVEEVPEFSGFGSAKKAATPTSTPAARMTSPTPSPVSRPSPSAAMPGRAGSVKWQQRPANRIGGARPLSMVAVENAQAGRIPEASNPTITSEELSRADIVKSLASRDPSWFRQTQDRGIGNAAFRKNADEIGAGDDMAQTSKLGLPGLTKELPPATSQRFDGSPTTARTPASTLDARNTAPSLDRSPSPTKELGGFVQSAMMKRSNSITKRSAASPASLDRTASLRSGFGGLQGSHSMPKLEQPTGPAASSTDSLPRPASSMNLTDTARGHARAKSITSAYTVNDHDRIPSAPSSPGKRWSPNKSSWIENALIAKPDSRPASPSKNSQPSWMSDLAKSNAAKASTDAIPISRSTMPLLPDVKQITAEPSSVAPTKPTTPKPEVAASTTATDLPKSKPFVSAKPQLSPKPQIDFRSTLKPRAATEPVPQEKPEFLSRFGTLRKTTTEKYVAPDTLKDNILRGKAGLSLTDGPQKTERRDEFKDSLLAKKEQWQQDKQDGVSYERKTAAPATPTKPEALMKREALSRGGTVRATSPQKEKQTTPEALKRHHTIRAKPAPTIPVAETSINTDVSIAQSVAEPAKPMTFNSQLAGLLARGPTASSISQPAGTHPIQVSAGPSGLGTETSRGKEEPLQDMRKGRAKGPKRRKAGTTMTTTADEEEIIDDATHLDTSRNTAIRPVASPAFTKIAPSPKPAVSPKPSTMLKERAPLGWDEDKTQSGAIPDLKGFSVATKDLLASNDEDKENKSATLLAMPSPSLRDEEAAMRSAKLLASAPRSPALNGLGISGGPPKPAKSSRSVSGQLQEASLNKVFSRFPSFRRESNSSTASAPRSTRIDARAVFTRRSTVGHEGRTIRKVLYQLAEDGRITIVSPRDEYTLCEDGIYLFLHVRLKSGGNLTTNVYTWIGRCAPHEHTYNLKIAQRALSSEHKSATLHTVRQGRESETFLSAMGGILVTKACIGRPSQPYMLCGRKHLGQLVFDQVDCKPEALCSAFVYIVWSPISSSEENIYLWQGSFCIPEEVSAARLIAMDLSSNGTVIELRDSEESSDFWKAFGDWPMREDVLTCPEVLKSKLKAGDAYRPRLFKLEKQETRAGFFASMLTRRPSWGARSPAPIDADIKYEAKELSPLIQADLDADCVYVLDSYARLDVLIGPTSTASSAEDGLYQHTMHFVEDYVGLCVEVGRPKPQCFVVNGGVPMHIPFLFRYWRYEHGLWGTAGLMAGLMHDKSDAQCLILQDALSTLQEKTLLEEPDLSEDKESDEG